MSSVKPRRALRQDVNQPVVIERGNRPPLSSKGRRRYEELIRGAARVFREKGYEASTIQDIAAAVGFQTGTIYHYVDGKEDLLLAVIKTFHSGTQRILEELDGSDDDPRVLLGAFIRRHVHELIANSDGGAVFNNDFRSLSGSNRVEVIQMRDEFEMFLRRLLDRGQAMGVLRPHSSKLTAMAILGMVNGILSWYSPDGPKTPDEIADEYAAVVLNGLDVDR